MLLLAASTLPAQAATLDLIASSNPATNGDSLSIAVVVGGLAAGSTPSLGDFDLAIDFDPTVLAFNSYALGIGLGSVDALEAFDASFGLTGPGQVNVAEVSFLPPAVLDSLQSDSFTLVTLNFTVLGADVTTALGFDSFVLGDAFGNSVAVDAANGTTVTVQPIPLPPTFWMMVSALAVLAGRGTARPQR